MNISLRPRSAHGYTLVELLVIIAATSMIIGIIGTLLFTLSRTDQGVRDHVAQTTTIHNLAARFRADVRASTEYEYLDVDEGFAFKLTAPRGKGVEYHVVGARISRVEWDGGEVRRRESFRFPAEDTIRLNVDLIDDDKPRNASFTITNTKHIVRIEAAFGMDQRYVQN